MGEVIYLSEYKKEQKDLIASLYYLFEDLDRTAKIVEVIWAFSRKIRREDQERLQGTKAFLHLECGEAIKLKIRDPIMERARDFYKNPS